MGIVFKSDRDSGSLEVIVKVGEDATSTEVVEALVGFMKATTYQDSSIYSALENVAAEGRV